MAYSTSNRDEQVVQQLLQYTKDSNQGTVSLSYQSLTVTSGAVVQLTIPASTMRATITVERDTATAAGAMVRFTTDGTTPVTGASGAATHGTPITDLSTVTITGNANLVAFKAIAVTATNCYLRVQYFN